jgi:manganese/zinc/iron transport system permease protein
MMDWLPGLSATTRLILEGVILLSACAGVIGCFAVLRRRALVGDALSHAALPGLFIGYLVFFFVAAPEPTNEPPDPPPLLYLLSGALAAGVLGILAISALRRWTRIKEDAAIGIVLSVFFGGGIVLKSIVQRIPEASRAGLQSFIVGQTAGMSPDNVVTIRWLALACLVLVVLFYKEFKLIAFDPGFGRVQGWPTVALDLLLMSLIAVAVVIGLPAVGVMLMAALLILPAAAARFWTERLSVMLFLSAAFAVAAGTLGVLLSVGQWHDLLVQHAPFLLFLDSGPTGPTIILVAGVLFLVSVLFAPRRGGIARWLAQRRFREELRHGHVQAPELYE